MLNALMWKSSYRLGSVHKLSSLPLNYQESKTAKLYFPLNQEKYGLGTRLQRQRSGAPISSLAGLSWVLFCLIMGITSALTPHMEPFSPPRKTLYNIGDLDKLISYLPAAIVSLISMCHENQFWSLETWLETHRQSITASSSSPLFLLQATSSPCSIILVSRDHF